MKSAQTFSTDHSRATAMDAEAQKELPISAAYPKPTQSYFNKLFGEIYVFIKDNLATSSRLGKPSLFIIGETHPTLLGKSSLVVEKMFVKAAAKLGIKKIYFENGPEQLKQKLDYRKPHKESRLSNPAHYKHINERMNIGNHIVSDPIISKFKLMATEPVRVEGSPAREKVMFNTVAKGKETSLFIVGNNHLQNGTENKLLQEKYHVVPVCTQPTEILLRYKESASPHDRIALDYATNPLKVKQFGIRQHLHIVDADKLSAMVDKAEAAFEKEQRQEAVRIFEEKVPAEPIVVEHKELPAPTSCLALPPVDAPDRVSNTTYSVIGSLNTAATLFQGAMWAGSLFGFCANPFFKPAAIKPAPATLAEKAEKSAALRLRQMGLTSESALKQLFGKKFTAGTAEDKEQMKNFMTDVLNGNVSPEVGNLFNQASILVNLHERAKQLTTLMHSSAAEREYRRISP